MGWEARPGGLYFYAATREGNRVRRRYMGRGEAAHAAAELEVEARARRRVEAEAVAAEQSRLAPLDEAMEALDLACNLALEAAPTSSGYH